MRRTLHTPFGSVDFVVRSVLVTGLNLDIGRHMRWPNKLSAKEDIDLNEIRQDDRALVNRPV